MRRSPAAARSWATRRSVAPFVVRARSTSSAGQLLDQHGEVGPDRRLAAGEADAVEAEALDAHLRDPGQLLVGEQLVAGEPRHPLRRHAVRAAEVAAVGDRDAQVAVDPAEAVDEVGRGRGGAGNAGIVAGHRRGGYRTSAPTVGRLRSRGRHRAGGRGPILPAPLPDRRELGQAVGAGHGRELVGALGAGRAHVVATVGRIGTGVHPGEVDLAVGATSERLVGDGVEHAVGSDRRRPARPSGAGRDGRRARSSPWTTPGCREGRTTGTPTPPGRVTVPKASGFAGRMATCIHRMSPDAIEDHLDEVEVAHAHPTAGDQGVAPQRRRHAAPRDGGLVVGDETEVDDVEPAHRHQTSAAPDDWSRGSGPAARGRPPSTSSSPVDRTPTTGRRTDDRRRRHPRWPGRPRCPGVSTVARGDHDGRRLRGRRRADGRGGRERPAVSTSTTASSSPTRGALDHHHGIGAPAASAHRS